MGAKLIIVAALLLILYNLGAGLFFMMVDRGATNRTLHALTWRIGLSVALIFGVMGAAHFGWITLHDVGR